MKKLQEDLSQKESENTQLQDQINSFNKEQLSLIEHLETSQNLSFNTKDLSQLKKQFDLNASTLADLTTQRETSLQKILECLKNAGIDGVEELM